MDTKKLRQKILDLAIHGKLVPQDPNDEPASVLLERIRAEKERLVKEGKIKKSKTSKTSDTPHYENVPFEVPKGWCWCNITDVTSKITDGTHHSPENGLKGDYKYVTAKNIKSSGIVLDNITYVNKEVHDEIYSRCNPEKGDILYIKDGATTGIVAINNLEEPFSLLSSVALIKPLGGIFNEYLLYYLQSSLCYNSVRESMKGVGITRITLKQIEKWEIPLPPQSEQQRIVTEIERWFTLIDQIEQGKADLQTTIKQTKSKILDLAIHGKLVPQDPNDEPASELLKRINPKAEITCDNGQYGKVPEGWTICKIEDLFDIVSAKRVLKSDWQSCGIPFYRAREIVQLHNEGRADKDLFITEQLFSELKEKYGIPTVGDIMLSAVGSIGYTYIVNKNDTFYYKDASVLCLRNINNLNSSYVSLLFETTFVREQMYDNSKGTTVDTITIEKLRKYSIPLPPLAEQQRIVDAIDKAFAKLDAIMESL